MSVYLQRLLARVGGAPVPAAFGTLTPVAAFASPLAQHDQRLGLPEFDVAAGEGEGLDEATASTVVGEVPAQPPAQARAPEPRRFQATTFASPDDDAPIGFERAAQLPDAAPAPAPLDPLPPQVHQANPLPFQAPPLFDITPGDFEPAPQPAPPLGAEESEPAPAAHREREAPGLPPLDPATAPESAPVRKDAAAGVAPEPVPVAPALPEPEPAAKWFADAVDPAGRAASAVAPEPMPIEPSERERAEPIPAEYPDAPAPGQVVIEEVVIEVGAPMQQQSAGREARANAMPATAAAASLIGPLPSRRSAITLYGMRRH